MLTEAARPRPDPTAPPATEAPDAWWLFGLCRDTLPLPTDLPAELAPLRRHPIGPGLVAVLGPAHVADWTGPAAEARLAELTVLGPLVTLHHAVVDALHRAGPVVPASFATLHHSPEAVAAHLGPAAPDIAALLDRLAGHDEYALRGRLDRAAAVAARVGPAPSRQSGGAWLRHRRALRDAERAVGQTLQAQAQALAATVQAHCRDTRQLPVRDAGGEGEAVLSWALLCPRDGAAALRAAVDTAAATLAPAGLHIQLGAPLPPWSFCALPTPSAP